MFHDSSVVPLEVLAQYHPCFALAIARGVPCRPNNRVVQAQFSTTATATWVDANFDAAISVYSVFSGFRLSSDPTGNIPGNTFKTLSDTMQAQTTGLGFTLSVKGGDEYTPIPTMIPLQLVDEVLKPVRGVWALWLAQQVFARFTIQGSVPAPNFTAWGVFSFMTLAGAPDREWCLSQRPEDARARLRDMGILCACGPSSPIVPAGPAPMPFGQPPGG
jgi:hypothetical protein